MYADDLVMVTNDKDFALQVIQTVKDWCEVTGMVLNASKSGVMRCGTARTKIKKAKELGGIPLVDTYRYLGGNLHYSLRIDTHPSIINRKIDFIRYKLTPLRLVKDLKLNLNMFKVFCAPLYRLAFNNLEYLSKAQINKFLLHFRKNLKKFALLPSNTPNLLL